ncbi:MAG: hypothetical protein P8J87_04165 [Verrucomicrobiales bacterium]|nr:hypothetical protein [Verrucomicrobiales bacterium]
MNSPRTIVTACGSGSIALVITANGPGSGKTVHIRTSGQKPFGGSARPLPNIRP